MLVNTSVSKIIKILLYNFIKMYFIVFYIFLKVYLTLLTINVSLKVHLGDIFENLMLKYF